MFDSQYVDSLSALSSTVIYKAINPPSSSFFLTQPQGQTRSSAITQQQMARNLPLLSQQITRSRHSRHCQASFRSSPPRGLKSLQFVCLSENT